GFQDIALAADGRLQVKLKSASDASAARDVFEKTFPDMVIASGEGESGTSFLLKFKPIEEQQVRKNAIEQALETIRNRIDQLGVRETTVVQQGDNEILIQLPGIQDPERAKELIGKTAVLQFKM